MRERRLVYNQVGSMVDKIQSVPPDRFIRALDFLEGVYSRRGPYRRSDLAEESTMDILVLNFTKVVNDCRG